MMRSGFGTCAHADPRTRAIHLGASMPNSRAQEYRRRQTRKRSS